LTCSRSTEAAAYSFGLSKNHGFVDGNERVAFMAMHVFLALNGYEINASEEEIDHRNGKTQ